MDKSGDRSWACHEPRPGRLTLASDLSKLLDDLIALQTYIQGSGRRRTCSTTLCNYRLCRPLGRPCRAMMSWWCLGRPSGEAGLRARQVSASRARRPRARSACSIHGRRCSLLMPSQPKTGATALTGEHQRVFRGRSRSPLAVQCRFRR